MKITLRMSCLLLIVGAALLFGVVRSTSADEQEKTISTLLDRKISDLGKRLVDTAEAMPEEKYNFAPSNGEFKGVMTFGEQVSHIAEDNYGAFATVLGEKPNITPGGSGPSGQWNKAEIISYLRDSFTLGHRAVTTLTPENVVAPLASPGNPDERVTRLELVLFVISHSENHYGQIVEYLRMNGIIPPASRPPAK